MDKAAAPEAVVSDAERAGGIVALADSGGGPMTSENLMNFGKAGRKAFGQVTAGTGEHLRAEDVDAEFIDMASDDRFGGAPGEEGEGVIAVGELANRLEVSGRHRFSYGGLKGGGDFFVGAVVPPDAFSGRVGETAAIRAAMPEGKRLAEKRRIRGLGDDGEGRIVLRHGAHDEDHRLVKCHGGERVRVIGMGGDKAADGILTKPEPGQPRFEMGSVSRTIGRQMDFDRLETSGAHGHLDTGGQRLE